MNDTRSKVNNEKESQKLPTFDEINKIIHEPARLLILVNLYLVKRAESLFLKNNIGLTWGNLGNHINKLEEVGYIDVKKEFKKKKPITMINLTLKGKKAFEEYKNNMKNVFN